MWGKTGRIGFLLCLFGLLFAGCTKNLIERSEYQRSILVEKGVYEYSLDVNRTPSSVGFSLLSFLPRHQFAENWELTHLPMPLLQYRFLNLPSLELGVHFGSVFLPLPDNTTLFTGRTPTYSDGKNDWFFPDNVRLGLEGKARLGSQFYVKAVNMNDFFFADLAGRTSSVDLRLGKQLPSYLSVELGVYSIFASKEFTAAFPDDWRETNNQTDLTVNLHVNGMPGINLNPYYELIHLSNNADAGGAAFNNFSLYGMRLIWFW